LLASGAELCISSNSFEAKSFRTPIVFRYCGDCRTASRDPLGILGMKAAAEFAVLPHRLRQKFEQDLFVLGFGPQEPAFRNASGSRRSESGAAGAASKAFR